MHQYPSLCIINIKQWVLVQWVDYDFWKCFLTQQDRPKGFSKNLTDLDATHYTFENILSYFFKIKMIV